MPEPEDSETSPPQRREADGPPTVQEAPPRWPSTAAKPAQGRWPGKPVEPSSCLIVGRARGRAAASAAWCIVVVARPARARHVRREPAHGRCSVRGRWAARARPTRHRARRGLAPLVARSSGLRPLEQTVDVDAGQEPPVPHRARSLKPEAPARDAAEERPSRPGRQRAAAAHRHTPVEPRRRRAKTPESLRSRRPSHRRRRRSPPSSIGEEGADIIVDGKSVGKMPNAKARDLEIGKTYKFTGRSARATRRSRRVQSDGNPEVQGRGRAGGRSRRLGAKPNPAPAEP